MKWSLAKTKTKYQFFHLLLWQSTITTRKDQFVFLYKVQKQTFYLISFKRRTHPTGRFEGNLVDCSSLVQLITTEERWGVTVILMTPEQLDVNVIQLGGIQFSITVRRGRRWTVGLASFHGGMSDQQTRSWGN